MNLLKNRLKSLYVLYEKLQSYFIVYLLTPSFFIFEMTIVRPKIVEAYKIGATKELIHILLSSFCFTNVFGNMMMTIFTQTNVKRPINEGVYCHKCCINMPDGAWHCNTCDICILKRDHHCFFFSQCIGFYNQRYYLLCIFYINISMIYSCYYNYYYVSLMFKDGEFTLSAFKIINPFLRFVLPEPMGLKELYILFLLLNVGLLVWSSCLLTFHARNVLRGVTARQSLRMNSYDMSKWRENLLQVFGRRWYLTLMWPFAISPTPVCNKLH